MLGLRREINRAAENVKNAAIDMLSSIAAELGIKQLCIFSAQVGDFPDSHRAKIACDGRTNSRDLCQFLHAPIICRPPARGLEKKDKTSALPTGLERGRNFVFGIVQEHLDIFLAVGSGGAG
jgi:hypothetical protein